MKNNNEEFSIEYWQPGMVRAGRYDMIDFALVYREDELDFHFHGEGIWSSDDRRIGYEVKIPTPLKGYIINSDQHNKMICIIRRVKDYVESDVLKWHSNVWMEDFCDQAVSFITENISETDRQRIGFEKLTDDLNRPLNTGAWTVDRDSGTYLIEYFVQNEDNRNIEAFWFCWQDVLMRVKGKIAESRTDGGMICNWSLLSVYPPLPANLKPKRDGLDAAIQLALARHLMHSPEKYMRVKFSGFTEEAPTRKVKNRVHNYKWPDRARTVSIQTNEVHSRIQSPRAFAFGLKVRAFLQKQGWIN